jgi:ribonucleotide monophosphatase NagD (HAD superfamily)
MFDLDGTLVRRPRDGAATALPGAGEVLAAIRASGRPLVVFTNASHVAPGRIAAMAREAGLDLRDDEVVTPLCSGGSHMARRHRGAGVFVLGTDAAKARIAEAGVDAELRVLERAAHAILAGARFYTANYERAYAGANGPILSRSAMVSAAIAKAAARRPVVVGKPSKPALREVSARLGVPPADIAFIGDDVAMDIALGKLAGARTVLVASGISGGETRGVPARRRPDRVLGGVAELLDLL